MLLGCEITREHGGGNQIDSSDELAYAKEKRD
jgi:hypothetical protein